MLSSPSGGSTPSRTSSARASSIPLRFRRVALRDSDEFGLVQIEIRLRSTPTPTPPPSAVVIYIPRPPRRAAHLGETTSRVYSAAARIPPRAAILVLLARVYASVRAPSVPVRRIVSRLFRVEPTSSLFAEERQERFHLEHSPAQIVERLVVRATPTTPRRGARDHVHA